MNGKLEIKEGQKKISELTPEQQAYLVEFRQKWFEIGTSTAPADWQKAEAAITKMYGKVNEKVPTFVRCASPLTANFLIAFLKSGHEKAESLYQELLETKETVYLDDVLKKLNLGKDYKPKEKLQFEYTYFWGSQESYWIAYYLFYAEIGVQYKPEDMELLNLWKDIAESITWFYPYSSICFICDRPKSVKFQGGPGSRLHNEYGPSVEFRDGLKVFSLNGVRVPEWLITTPKDQINPEDVLALTNTEQRYVAMRYVGMSKFLTALKAELLDTFNEYKLYLLNVEGRQVGPYLFMKCPSTGREYLEGVGDAEKYDAIDPTIKTCEAAINWRIERASAKLVTDLQNKFSVRA